MDNDNAPITDDNEEKLTCELCECELTENNSYFINSNNGQMRVCEDCESCDSFFCIRCEEIYYTNDFNYTTTDDGTFCDDCFNERYTQCCHCNRDILRDDSYDCDSCGDSFCETCYYDHPCMNDDDYEAREYGKKIRGENPGAIITSERLAGVELELIRHESGHCLNDELPSCVGLQSDGSLSDNGVEVITPPASREELEHILKIVCTKANNIELKPDDSCGCHIHIEANDFKEDNEKLSELATTYYMIEPLIVAMLPESRRNNSYCKRLTEKYNINNFYKNKQIDIEWYKDYSVNSRKSNKYDNSRYTGINLHSIFFRGTLEVRYLEGSNNYNNIVNWIALHQGIVDWVASNYKRESLYKFRNMRVPLIKKFTALFNLFSIKNETRRYLMKRVEQFNFTSYNEKDYLCAE